MQNVKYIFISLFLIAISCKPEQRIEIEDCSEDCLMLSEIKTKTDYYSPVKLYNDISDLQIITLNGEEIDLQYGHSYLIEESGFYELILHYNNRSDREILFTLKTPERENAEWGIETWIPAMFDTQLVTDQEIKVIYPRKYIEGMSVPIIFYLYEGALRSSIYAEAFHNSSDSGFYIKRGVGSISISSEAIDKSNIFSIGTKVVEVTTTRTSGIDLELSGEISEDLIITENSVVAITGDINIPSHISLTFNPGALIVVDEAININNEGSIEFIGEEHNPVLVTSRNKGRYWGGFLSTGASGTISAVYTIFAQSGYHAGGSYNWGHAQRQALFYINESSLNLAHCYIIDHAGQIFYPVNATLEINSILIQRAKTGGEMNYSTATIKNSVFTDFPDDSRNYRDLDNDAIYINGSDVSIDNCVFMFAKDDGLDAGSNFSGTIHVSDCHFEACFHEGAAISSPGDGQNYTTFINCVFYNCGQGLELGFSSPNHQVNADNCDFVYNGIGIRYGDNYTWSAVNGTMVVKNSRSTNNTRDVWNMVRSTWSPKIEYLQFENVSVSSFVDQYPDLIVIKE